MQATVSASEPLLLMDICHLHGRPFLPLTPAFSESVCMLLPESASNDLLAANQQRMPKFNASHCYAMVIASRVGLGDARYVAPGSVVPLNWDEPVIALELVERLALRQATPEPNPTATDKATDAQLDDLVDRAVKLAMSILLSKHDSRMFVDALRSRPSRPMSPPAEH